MVLHYYNWIDWEKGSALDDHPGDWLSDLCVLIMICTASNKHWNWGKKSEGSTYIKSREFILHPPSLSFSSTRHFPRLPPFMTSIARTQHLPIGTEWEMQYTGWPRDRAWPLQHPPHWPAGLYLISVNHRLKPRGVLTSLIEVETAVSMMIRWGAIYYLVVY